VKLLLPALVVLVALRNSRVPRARFVELDEITALISWMVCAENSYTTGATFDLTGGRSSY
jgi:3-oxoacyl-[acyl-carrier protein] reductase